MMINMISYVIVDYGNLLEIEKFRSLNEFRTTETELRAMAAAASIGCKAGPPKGTNNPAATGILIKL